MRTRSDTGPALERARLTPAAARLNPALLAGTWYDVVPGSVDELGGMFLVVAGAERYVQCRHFEVVPIERPAGD